MANKSMARKATGSPQEMLAGFSTDRKRQSSQKFFKTAPGEYGHGDQFIGVTVPEIRSVALKYRELPFAGIQKLIQSKIHEERLLGLLILRNQFETVTGPESRTRKNRIVEFFLRHKHHVNNWDLVDSSAPYLSGPYWFHEFGKNARMKELKALASSPSLWDRRISVVSTFYFIRQHSFQEILALIRILIHDPEDLMHKAMGWMLREVGKRDLKVLLQFLDEVGKSLPRTTLRYAIERLSPGEKKRYLTTTRFRSGTKAK